MSKYPTANPFPNGDRCDLIERYNTHSYYIIDVVGMVKNSMPKTFNDKMNWVDWKFALINFLKSQPGRNLFTLNYVVHDNVNPIARNNPNLLDDYSNITTL